MHLAIEHSAVLERQVQPIAILGVRAPFELHKAGGPPAATST